MPMPWPWLASGAGLGVTLGERAGDRTRAGVLALELVWVLDGAEARASGSSPTSTSSGPLVIRRVRGTRPLGDLPWVVVRCGFGFGFRLMVAAVSVPVALLRHAPCSVLARPCPPPPMSAPSFFPTAKRQRCGQSLPTSCSLKARSWSRAAEARRGEARR